MSVILIAATLAVIMGFTYALGMYLEGATVKPPSVDPVPALSFVFVIPCLDEARILEATLDRLTTLPLRDYHILVIDDGSTDDTYAIASQYPDRRIRVLRRTPPNARKGKGAALNAAIAYLRESDVVADQSADIVVCLLDADGHLDPEAPRTVLPYFRDPKVGGVQITVRINNRGAGWLARLQDMEFVVYTSIFQLARNRLGNAGLGGNGQFTRLSALTSLGPEPWANVLTEDLNLGVRMRLQGWSILFCPSVAVHQQGLLHLRRLLRQRSRWFQGHLQSWSLVPPVVRGMSGRLAAETLNVLLMPFLVIVGSFMTVSFVTASIGVAISPVAREQLLQPGPILSWYLLTFLPGILFAVVYSRRADKLPVWRMIVFGHAFILYGIMWMVAGYWGTFRLLRRQDGWLKTARLAETVDTSVHEPGVIAENSRARTG
jgi:1,2-diacylglycerol 3-beta-glucosyltransferase